MPPYRQHHYEDETVITKDIEAIVGYAKTQLQRAGIYSVIPSDNAPDTYEKICTLFNSQSPKYYVPKAGLADSIWGSDANHAIIRAWHDMHHWMLGATLSLVDEMRVSEHGINELRRELSLDPSTVVELWCEFGGQLIYHAIDGQFVKHQVPFVKTMATLITNTEAYCE